MGAKLVLKTHESLENEDFNKEPCLDFRFVIDFGYGAGNKNCQIEI